MFPTTARDKIKVAQMTPKSALTICLLLAGTIIVPASSYAQPAQIPIENAPCEYFTKRGDMWVILQPVDFGGVSLAYLTVGKGAMAGTKGDAWTLIEKKCGSPAK
jgi:hypothetical protein